MALSKKLQEIINHMGEGFGNTIQMETVAGKKVYWMDFYSGDGGHLRVSATDLEKLKDRGYIKWGLSNRERPIYYLTQKGWEAVEETEDEGDEEEAE